MSTRAGDEHNRAVIYRRGLTARYQFSIIDFNN
jgi:hypothetical protein